MLTSHVQNRMIADQGEKTTSNHIKICKVGWFWGRGIYADIPPVATPLRRPCIGEATFAELTLRRAFSPHTFGNQLVRSSEDGATWRPSRRRLCESDRGTVNYATGACQAIKLWRPHSIPSRSVSSRAVRVAWLMSTAPPPRYPTDPTSPHPIRHLQHQTDGPRL